MKTSDYIAKRIKREAGDVFGVTGGCIISVVDSFVKHGINVVSMQHEQSAAIAADAYARFNGFGVCYSTSGPGVTNLITGTCCSYFDSIPVLAISGQVPQKYLTGRDRQMGFQEVDGVGIFSKASKYATRYNNHTDLEECIRCAKTPRCGTAFIEISDDVQRVQIEEPQPSVFYHKKNSVVIPDITRFKRPLLIVGYGAINMPVTIEMPFLYSWAVKYKYYNHPFCKGGFGITGDSEGNKLIKEADCIIMLGTRMDSHMVPYWERFAPQAHKIAIGLDFPHKADEVVDCVLDFEHVFHGPNWCSRVKEDSPDGRLYKEIDEINKASDMDDIIIPDMGQTGCIVLQRWKPKEGQVLFNGMNHSPMGYAIPGAIGAAVATGRRVIVVVGDGSLMMNLQELQTIADLNLPINIFVVNNGGYGMIRQTQRDWEQYLLQGVGCNFNIPDVRKLADAFGIQYGRELSNRPSIYEIKTNDTRITPKWKYGDEL